MTTSASPRRSPTSSRSRAMPVEQPAAALQRVRPAGRLLSAAPGRRRRPPGTARGGRPARAARRCAAQVVEERPDAHVHDDGDATASRPSTRRPVGRRRRAARRQVVDDEPAEVLQRLGRGAPPGAGHAGDDHDQLAVRPVVGLARSAAPRRPARSDRRSPAVSSPPCSPVAVFTAAGARPAPRAQGRHDRLGRPAPDAGHRGDLVDRRRPGASSASRSARAAPCAAPRPSPGTSSSSALDHASSTPRAGGG